MGKGVHVMKKLESTGEDPNEVERPIHHNCSLKHSAALLSIITRGPEGGTGS